MFKAGTWTQVPAHCLTFWCSYTTRYEHHLPGMRSQTCVPDSCSSKHHSWSWVPPSSDSFYVKQPITFIHPVSHTNITVLSPDLHSLTLSLWLRVSITLESFIPLLRFSIHQLLTRNAKESSLQLQPASPPKVFLPRGTITTAQAKILSQPDKGSLEALIANDLRKPVLQFHSP